MFYLYIGSSKNNLSIKYLYKVVIVLIIILITLKQSKWIKSNKTILKKNEK